MPIAAVPRYLGNDFTQASPGLRFGLLLGIWTPHWEKDDQGARQAWNRITALTPGDQARIKALHDRQVALSSSYAGTQMLAMEALATAPFTTGLGNEHPLENGFAFLNPYGIPYLPGSGVKGVLRQAARELAEGKWGDALGWNHERLNVLFGYESQDGETTHVRGALSFWDVIPQIQGNSLSVEIMTPHQGHYYQQNAQAGSMTPHESGQPIPISFLTVPPGSGFSFHVVCDTDHLNRLAPVLAENEEWKTLLKAAFEHAFQWLGFGAKTAVGYGAMKLDQDKIDEQNRIAREQQAQREKEERKASMTANEIAVDTFITECEKRKRESNGVKERQNTGVHQKAQQLIKKAREPGMWTDSEKELLVNAVKKWLSELTERMDKDAFKKLKLSELSPS